MKKVLLTLSLLMVNFAWAQFSSGTVSLGTTGMTVKLDTSPTLVTITLTGSDASYLGIGFGNVGSGMAVGSDGFIYNSSASRDYTFGGLTTPTADAVQDWTQTSNTAAGGIRTVVATRSLVGGAGDTAIANSVGNINIFFAKGTGIALSSGYHGAGNRGYATLAMTAATLGTSDLIADSKKIILYPNPAKETVNFKNADKIKSIDIYESIGRKVKSVKIDGDHMDVTDLKTGSYYLEITLKDGSLSYEKLIKE